MLRSKDVSKENERTKKWIEMLANWEWWIQNKRKKIRTRCLKGIPDRVRSLVWKKLSQYDEKLKCDIFSQHPYSELSASESEWEEQILKDVPRTFPSYVDFSDSGTGFKYWLFSFYFTKILLRKEKLLAVLKAYSVLDPELGYCQGMSYLCACMTMYYSTEVCFLSTGWCLFEFSLCCLLLLQESFYMFALLLNPTFGYGLRHFYTATFPLFRGICYATETLLEEKLPKLYKHLFKLICTFLCIKPSSIKKHSKSTEKTDSETKSSPATVPSAQQIDSAHSSTTSPNTESEQTPPSASASSSSPSSSSSSVSKSKDEYHVGQIIQIITQPWILSFFTYSFPFDTVLRFIDVFFFDGPKTFVSFTLGFLSVIQSLLPVL